MEDCKCGKCYIEKQSHDDRFAGMYYLKWYDGENTHTVKECPDCGDDKEATLNRRYIKSLCKQRDKLTAEIEQIEKYLAND